MHPLTCARWTSRAVAVLLAVVLLAPALVACDDADTQGDPGDAGAVPGTGGGTGGGGTGGGGTGGSDGGTLEILLSVLATGTRTERAQAASDLGELGDDGAVPALVEALDDESWEVRAAVATALGRLPDPVAVGRLLALLAREPASPEVREDDLWAAREACNAAIGALAAIGDPAATARLVEIAVDEDTALDREAARAALAAFGEAAMPGIKAALADAPAATAPAVVWLLGRLGEPAVGPLAAALQDRRAAVRIAAAEVLGDLGDAAYKPLLAALKAKDRNLRAAAARSLGDVGDPRATPSLVKLLQDAKTRHAAVVALVAIHRDNATPLVKYLKAKATVQVYRPLIRIGQADTVTALAAALKRYGTKAMGETYLNCGEPRLEKAARQWARSHGYIVVPSAGAGEEAWGDR